MRTLAEYQAEVFRRSEKKMRARKKRRKCAFALCIPTVLCMACCLWKMNFVNENNENVERSSETWGIEAGKIEFDSLLISRIDVTWGDACISCTDAEQVRKIASILGRASVAYGNRTPIDTSPDAGETSRAITLILDDGEVMEYCLVGNVLISEGSSCPLYLSQEQVDELCRILDASTQ